MKKFFILSLIVVMAFCFVSCSNSAKHPSGANELIELSKDATLHIGSNTFVNSVDEDVTDMYLTYTSNVTYILNRVYRSSSTNIPDGHIQAGEGSRYYYYWTTSTTTEQALLGKRTEKTTYTHSYLPYADGESVIVKTTAVKSYEYNYQGGFIDKEFTYTFDLNGYFESYEAMAATYPELAQLAYTGNTSDKYYVDTITPTSTTSDTEVFNNTYYYISYHDTKAEATK